MKPLLLIFIAVFMACSSPKQDKQEQNAETMQPETTVEFKEEIHDFGLLESGETIVYSFTFTNSGTSDLIIKNVESDCGCISTSYSDKPVKPGETGFIEVEFNTSGLFGKQFKPITVEANVKEPKHLAIFAEVNNELLEFKY